MIVRLNPKDLLRLRKARGVEIRALAGRVWITEDGAVGDYFLEPGRSYRVRGNGLVLLEGDNGGNRALTPEIAVTSYC